MNDTVGVTRVLNSRIVFKIYSKSSFKYLVTKNIARDATEGSGLGLELKAEDFWVEDFSSSSILLFMGEATQDIKTTKGIIKSAIKV